MAPSCDPPPLVALLGFAVFALGLAWIGDKLSGPSAMYHVDLSLESPTALARQVGKPPFHRYQSIQGQSARLQVLQSGLPKDNPMPSVGQYGDKSPSLSSSEISGSGYAMLLVANIFIAAVVFLRRHFHQSTSSTAMASLSSLKVGHDNSRPLHPTTLAAASAEIETLSQKGRQPVSKIMSKMPLITVPPDATIDTALELMATHEIGALPVVDANNKVLGIVSDFDLLCVEIFMDFERSKDVFPLPGENYDHFKELKLLASKQSKRTVQEVMTPSPVTISPDTTIKRADRMLIQKKVARLPVVDENGILLGIVSRSHIIRTVLASMGSPVIMEVGRPPVANLTDLRPDDPVSKVMTERQVKATPDTPIDEAFRQMIGRRIRGIVVVDDEDVVVGVASDYDLLMVDTIDNFKTRKPTDAFPKPAESYSEFEEIKELLNKQSARTVGQVMTTNPFCVQETATFAEALLIFAETKVARIPVVNARGKCVGVLTRARAITALILMRQNQNQNQQ